MTDELSSSPVVRSTKGNEVGDRQEVRQHGDPSREYRAATTSAAMVDRSHRTLLVVSGRAPTRMLHGVITGSLPPDLEEDESGMLRGRMPYSTILTPKGKVVTDLRLARLENGEEGSLLMELPPQGTTAALSHLRKYLPPRFAQLSESDDPLGLLTLLGPGSADLISRELLEGRVSPEELAGLSEGEERILPQPGTFGIRVIRNGDVSPLALDVIAPAPLLSELWRRLEEAGTVPTGTEVWETLRLEKGRPSYGVELDEDTLPPEAGIETRAIDHEKGCYTGQEVIVRIRDRGRVNRRLRGLLLGDAVPPPPGTPIYHPGRDRPSGEVRSTAKSPQFGQGIALAYLRREVEPPALVRLGSEAGPEVQVRALDPESGWILNEGDPGAD